MEIDFDNWSRSGEVLGYAAAHNISIAEAIEQLVNSGLSYESDYYGNR